MLLKGGIIAMSKKYHKRLKKKNQKNRIAIVYNNPVLSLLDGSHKIYFNNNNYANKCYICRKDAESGSRFTVGDDYTGIYICDSCLINFEKILKKGKTVDIYKKHIRIFSKISSDKCNACSKTENCKHYYISLYGFNFCVCPMCYEKLISKSTIHNKSYNEIVIKQKKERKAKITKQLQEEERKAKEEERKAKQESVLVRSTFSKLQEIEYYYSLQSEYEKSEFINQYKNSRKWASKKYINNENSAVNINQQLKVVPSYNYIPCSAQKSEFHQCSNSKYYIYIDDEKYEDFQFALCKKTIKDLKFCLLEMLRDGFLPNAQKGSISIYAMYKPIKNEERICYFSKATTNILLVEIGYTHFYVSRDIAEKLYYIIFYNMAKQYPPKIINKDYRDYSTRVMKCSIPKQSKLILGYSRKEAQKTSIEFLIDYTFIPLNCECLEHSYSNPAKAVITTNHANDNFCLPVCETCIDKYIDYIEGNIKKYTRGTEIQIIKATWGKTEHCMFCGENKGHSYRHTLGSAEFKCCEDCQDKLLIALKTAQNQIRKFKSGYNQ